MKTIYKALKHYGYRIGQVESSKVDVDSMTGLLELTAHIDPVGKMPGLILTMIEAQNTMDNYDRLSNFAAECNECAIANN